MANPSSSIVGIAAVFIFAALIGLIFIGQILGMVDDQKRTHAIIDSDQEMMKLVLYDSMIAYTCDEGGNWDGVRGKGGQRHWGSWKELRGIWTNPLGEIEFDELNQSMPFRYKGMPCRGTASNLPLSGGKLQATGITGQEWVDDQEGQYSRIKFKINESVSSPVTLPHCFTHFTEDTFPDHTAGTGDMYEHLSGNQITSSWFLVTAEDEKSAFHIGGAGQSTSEIDIHYDCTQIAKPGAAKKDEGNGPIMSVNVIDNHVGGLPLSSTETPFMMGGGVQSNDDDIAHFAPPIDVDFFKAYTSTPPHDDDPRPLREYEFPAGTRGYVQTNIGCDAGSAPYTLTNQPGISDSEITDNGNCANNLHPFIVITEIP